MAKRRSFGEAWAAPGFDNPDEETPWGRVFKVDGVEMARIPLLQLSGKDFELGGTLEYTGEMGLEKYTKIPAETKNEARTLTGTDLGKTDLASIPPFLRWLANPYGRYTPAALIHDHLIVGGQPNTGTLGSDTASDRYWRYMLQAVGVPRAKRWIMWAATAFRTRWAVKGWRRFTVIAWIVLAAVGITAAVVSAVALTTGGDLPNDAEPSVVLSVAVLLPLAASALWGRQYGAGLVASGAALWLLPPAILGIAGYAVYWAIERFFYAVRWR